MINKNQMLDLNTPEAVEIRVRGDGKVVWVNVDGQCVFRCFEPKLLEVIDERTLEPSWDQLEKEAT